MTESIKTIEDEDDNHEWTDEDFARAITFDQLPQSLQEKLKAINAIGRSRGRPRKEAPKREVKLRLDPDVVESFKATGKGWQTRMNLALREWIATYQPVLSD